MLRRLCAWLKGEADARDAGVAPAPTADRIAAGATGASRPAEPRTPAKPRTPAQRRGERAEDAALAHLQASGLALVERNYRARGGEIDLVMREGAVRVFVEVRHRSGAGHGDGLDSVARSKQRRLLAAARQYLAERPEAAREPLRFDVVASGAGGLRWVRDAFRFDEGGW